jgi:hypothetical protein
MFHRNVGIYLRLLSPYLGWPATNVYI